MIWLLLLFTPLAHAEENIYLMGADAYVTECSPHTSCVRESENFMLQIPIEDRNNGSWSGSYADFSHLPTGELFTYEFVAIETAKKLQVLMNCKFESLTGDLIYQCPTKINEARDRASLKKFNFINEIKFGGRKFNVQISYSSAQ